MLGLLTDTLDAIKAIYNFIYGSIAGFFNYIVDVVKYIIKFLTDWYDATADFSKDVVLSADYVGDWLSATANATADFIKDFAPLLVDSTSAFIIAAFDLVTNTCQSCYDSISTSFSSSITDLASANTFSETVYYCLYQSDVAGAFTLLSCGITVYVFRKSVGIITFGLIRL
ncbi:MAG: hypothetical protein WCK96_18015 [Methylococcales bacterium]